MANQILVDGARNAVVKMVGAGTIDVSTLVGAPAKVRIDKIQYDVGAATDAVLSWDATTDVVIAGLSGRGEICAKHFGGLTNNAGAGVTGDIVLGGTGANITVILELVK